MTVVPVEEGVRAQERFAFGRNWASFLRVITDRHIEEAKKSLRDMLGVSDLSAKRFLDIGSGSGLFSLAAIHLGAANVLSIDYDAQCVACALELRRRYASDKTRWETLQGSVLDDRLIERLGEWDIVYSWGVLHHTGSMWRAIDNAASLVAPRGLLLISIYNDQGRLSRFWRRVKATYNRSAFGKAFVLSIFIPYFTTRGIAADLLRLRNPWDRYRNYKSQRGMSMVHDRIDWLGGYPFEVAKPEQIVEHLLAQGFSMRKLRTCGGGHGCNEFVFQRT
jgi:2-polyprenyl-3-methyl-5-hydroxy-6-metoxy-1,4-benzoquinol methylase